jgi:putative ABC transport system permease protein
MNMIADLWQDVRYGARMLMKNPGFTLIAVITLALGIGANTAIFSVVNAILLRPLPYANSERLLQVFESAPPDYNALNSVAPGNFSDWRNQNQSFEEMAAVQTINLNLTGSGDPEQLGGARVTANYFSTLGFKPAYGRDFLHEEDQPGRNQVVVLSDRLWRRRFGADPALIGRVLTLNGESYTVIGITPEGLPYSDDTEMWTPIAFSTNEANNHGSHYLGVFARLKPDLTLEQARAEMRAIARQLEAQYPATNTDKGVRIEPLQKIIVGDFRSALLLLTVAVAFVLLIACANVANLLLARAVTRHKEFAVRAALGASRWRIVRQLLAESVLLSLLGGVAGGLLAVWGVGFATKFLSPVLPRSNEIAVDLSTLCFTLAVALFIGLIFGLAPALQSSRPDLNVALKEGGKGVGTFTRSKLRAALVIAEVALSLLLLIGAALLIESFVRLLRVDPGFNPQNLLTLRISLPKARYGEKSQQAQFFLEVVPRIAALPGVQAVGASGSIPFRWDFFYEFIIDGRAPIERGKEPSAQYYAVNADYFRAMGIPLLKGRTFTERDTKDAPRVAIINESLARSYFPDEDPIGKRITFNRGGFGIWREIVGVVGDVKQYRLDSQSSAQIYDPFLQEPNSAISLAVRTTDDPMNNVAAVRRQVAEIDDTQPVASFLTMEKRIDFTVSSQRLSTLLLGIFAVIALVLAAAGIYGVMSYIVTQRTHELGIRMALGARTRDVLRLVIGQGMKLALMGVGIGLVSAIALTRLLETLLFDVSATDPLTFAVIAFLLTLVALLACWIPGRRATKVDPLVALRCD